MDFLEKAKLAARVCLISNSGEYISPDECYVVWFSKTLQNWKALVSTSKLQTNDYVEVTYDGDKDKIYVDIYNKVESTALDSSVLAGLETRDK